MTALDKQPVNTNFLNPLNFRFSIKRAPHINFFIQKVNIPSITLPSIDVGTPFHPIPTPGNELLYGDFSITFKVDEDFQNYLELYNWLIGLGFTDDFTQYAEIAAQPLISGNGITSDLTLMVLNSVQLPNYEFTILNAFPKTLSEVVVDTTPGTVDYVTATCSFSYLDLFVEKYNSS
ncbi:MAG: hypothetical protein ACXV2C_06780 [Candidatus Bathyarchaeia archaeon]